MAKKGGKGKGFDLEVDVTADPVRFEQAIKAFEKRVPITREDWDKLDTRERERAFMVSGVSQLDVIQGVYDEVDRAIRDGTTLEDFKEAVGGKLESAWGGPIPNRIETIFRTNVLGAYSEGRHAIYSAPAVKEARPFLRYDVIDDDRLCEICAPLDGVIRPQDDWSEMTPPAHFNALAEGTLVTTAYGPVRIESIQPGELVLTHRGRLRRVYAAMSKRPDSTPIRVTFSTGGSLLVTKEHPVLTSGGWKAAGDLRVGDQVFEHGEPVEGASGDRVSGDPKDFPTLFDEVPVSYEIVKFAVPVPVVLPVDLNGHAIVRDRKVNDVSIDGELRHELESSGQEEPGRDCLADRGVSAEVLRHRRGHARANVGATGGVASLHSSGGRGDAGIGVLRQSPCPVCLAGHGCVAGICDHHLGDARPNGDPVALTPRTQNGLAGSYGSLDGSDGLPSIPMPVSDEGLDNGSVGKVNWRHATITTIAAEQSLKRLWNLAVEEDETFVADGVIVHNCRCQLTPLSPEEAEEEGVAEEMPDVEPDDGFGAAPSAAGDDWQPDPEGYDEELWAELERKLADEF